jgi:hypothetical protein
VAENDNFKKETLDMLIRFVVRGKNFATPTFIEDRYSETNVMHFSFNLLRIKGLCMF